jgi:hypothetical protein
LRRNAAKPSTAKRAAIRHWHFSSSEHEREVLFR